MGGHFKEGVMPKRQWLKHKEFNLTIFYVINTKLNQNEKKNKKSKKTKDKTKLNQKNERAGKYFSGSFEERHIGSGLEHAVNISKMAALPEGLISRRIFLMLFIFSRCTNVYGWDSIDLELFDLVEDIKDNFYDILGLKQVRRNYIL